MKRKPIKLPPRYELKFNEKAKEYQVRKKFRYKDENGKTKDTKTKWFSSIEECEAYATSKMNPVQQEEEQVEEVKEVITVYNLLDLYIKVLEQKSKKIRSRKDLTVIHYGNVKTLRKIYTPTFIGNVDIENFDSEITLRWVKYINDAEYLTNNNDKEHTKELSGSSVRRYKGAIVKFIEYLQDNGVITIKAASELTMGVSRARIKSKQAGHRNDRNFPLYKDMVSLSYYFLNKGRGAGYFENFYWYTLVNVLFFTGMRVSELIALRWEDVDFDLGPGRCGIIRICDSINEKEKAESLAARYEARNKQTKNDNSLREISIWSAYRRILKGYKESYMYKFELEGKDMSALFVFPCISSKTDPMLHQKQRIIRDHIQNACAHTGLEKYDSQMFRHACAYFLCYDQQLSIESVHDYFGHKDSQMIRNVYTQFNVKQKRERVDNHLLSLITGKQENEDNKENEYVRKRLEVGEIQDELIKRGEIFRHTAQIKARILDGATVYKYYIDEQDVFDEIIKNNPEFLKKIELIGVCE